MNIRIEPYNEKFEAKWDEFVEKRSINGTFLQTRTFLNYHETGKFIDNSLLIFKGDNNIMAVIPACIITDNDSKIFYSHMGSTFGGIVLGREFNTISNVDCIFKVLNEYFQNNNFSKVIFKNPSDVFLKDDQNLLNYFLFKEGYNSYDEISSFIDLRNYKSDILSNFTSSRRRDYKYSLKHDLIFKNLDTFEEINEFYNILCENLKKHNSKPVHTFMELMDFKKNRLVDIVDFYGAYYGNILVAGSMIFKFNNDVFHTQYLCSNQSFLNLYPMNYLITNLIKVAMDSGFKNFSFGISTEEKGKVLNYSLAEFKEGFGTNFTLNKTFYKAF